jgi:nitrite reductase/ring-hydroxylating ferredoxin subunit
VSEPPIRVLATAVALAEGGGARFTVTLDGVRRDAFVVRWRGALHAWVNACRHQSLPLDFGDARFFDGALDALVCIHHGARFRPDTGECVEGPCRGAFLTPLRLEERADGVWYTGRAARRS